MRMVRNLILLVVVLGALIGSYYYVKNMKPKQETGETVDKTIFNVDKEKVSEITLTSENGTLTLFKEEDTWKIRGAEDVNLDQSAVSDLVYSSSTVTAESIVDENAQDLSPYGLDNPKVTVNVKLTDGESRTFLLGKMTPDQDKYYLREKGSNKVYTVWMSIGNHFSYTLDDLRDIPKIEMAEEDVQYVYMERKGRPTVKMIYKDTNEMGISNWLMTEPYEIGVDVSTLTEVIQKAVAMTVKDFVAEKADNPAEYGFDQPTAVIELRDKDGKVLKVTLGKEKDDKTYYCMINDSESVYTIEKTLVDFKDTPIFALAEKFAAIINIDTVDKATIQGLGTSGTIEITRKKVKNDKGEEETEESFFLDGKEQEEKIFKKYYQSLIGLLVDGEVDKEVTGTPEVTTVFYRNVEPKTFTVEYIPYDLDNYAARVNGKTYFYIRKDKVQSMIDTLKQFKEGKLTRDD